jgi:hypothetical protein
MHAPALDNPQVQSVMSRHRYQLTPALEQSIIAYIRAGGFPHVAAEAAGVPARVFDRWRRKGEARRSSRRYRAFASAVRQAVAQARLGAEVSICKDKPLDWLRSGPGRETPDCTGWTGTVRPRLAAAAAPALAHPEVQALITTLLELLEPHPEVRSTVAAALAAISEK